MALVASVDGANRRIYLGPDSVGADIHPVEIYKEVRTLRRINESLRPYNPFISAKGNDPKGGGKFTERYAVLLEGTRIVPYDTTQKLKITGTVITDDGQEGIVCFDRSSLTITSRVDIDYQPPQVEVIVINGGGGGSGITVETETQIKEIWQDRGLDIANPKTIDATSESAGFITKVRQRIGDILTVTRQ